MRAAVAEKDEVEVRADAAAGLVLFALVGEVADK